MEQYLTRIRKTLKRLAVTGAFQPGGVKRQLRWTLLVNALYIQNFTRENRFFAHITCHDTWNEIRVANESYDFHVCSNICLAERTNGSSIRQRQQINCYRVRQLSLLCSLGATVPHYTKQWTYGTKQTMNCTNEHELLIHLTYQINTFPGATTVVIQQ
jgi:hypothetical protein